MSFIIQTPFPDRSSSFALYTVVSVYRGAVQKRIVTGYPESVALSRAYSDNQPPAPGDLRFDLLVLTTVSVSHRKHIQAAPSEFFGRTHPDHRLLVLVAAPFLTEPAVERSQWFPLLVLVQRFQGLRWDWTVHAGDPENHPS